MDENHQGKPGSKSSTTEDNIWLPPLSPKEQKKVEHLHKKPFAERMGFAGKRPWDFIQLLLIPLVLAGVGYWFTATQTQISIERAADQQRETILKTCLDDIKDLLLNKGLRASKSKDEVRVVARVKVLSALRQLDGVRKGLLMQFLSETGLITSSSNDVIIDLSGSHRRSADLRGAHLSDTDLHGAYLIGADLHGADLRDAYLSHADLRNADLSHADLHGADLSHADLSTADLSRAKLDKTILQGARYNTKKISVKEKNGEIWGKWPPTQWPQGFNPKAAGAIEDNTLTMPDSSKYP